MKELLVYDQLEFVKSYLDDKLSANGGSKTAMTEVQDLDE